MKPNQTKTQQEQQIRDGLRGVREDHPVLKAVTALVDYQCEVADRATIDPHLSESNRTFNAGVEWGLKALRSSLQILHAQAQDPKSQKEG